ncbi:MAG: exopolysaccharide biosynthesis polyprenyl glycosylphosphotransferase [Oscillospiraceae bacterium]|nr:exopolysaccharide biosynthesis polyprenyl glycosylphosphotransferase [Oscillospiraceae bacterium]
MEHRKYRHLFSAGFGMLLLGLLTFWFGITWDRCYADVIIAPFFRRGNWVVILIYLVLTELVFKAYRCTRYGYLKRSDLIYYQLIGTTFVNVITYFQISLIGRRFMQLSPMMLLTAIDWFTVIGWSYAVGALYFRLFPPRRLVIVYGSAKAAELVMKMSTRVDKYMICESVSCSAGLREITKQLGSFDGVILCDVPAELRNDLLKYCCGQHLRVYITPKISDILMRGGDELRLFDTPLILCRNEGLSPEQRVVKRIFDVMISLILLILFSPVMLVCALSVYCEDRGAIFYRQKRLTRDGTVFEVLKFRSMIPDAEADGKAVLAAEHDDRITKTGRILRHFRLDELPQLINILRGEMSLVGPRPERPELAAEYAKKYPEFPYRLQVKAGLTGYAQVTGKYDTEPIDKLKMDLMYIEQYSPLLDIQILLLTLKTALFPPENNTSAIDSSQKEE